MLGNVQLNNDEDTLKRILTTNGHSTTASIQMLCLLRVVDVRVKELWQTRLPLKIRIFLWLIYIKTGSKQLII
jgi:hypothetical protein